MFWFDEATSYGSPSYYVQQMYGQNMGDFTLETGGQEKELAKEKLYYSVSYAKEADEIILKIVNGADAEQKVEVALGEGWNAAGADAQAADAKKTYRMTLLTCEDKDASNSIEQPCKVAPVKMEGSVSEGITLPAHSFAVVRI
jgi:alpha-N-arabinofuranosidase